MFKARKSKSWVKGVLASSLLLAALAPANSAMAAAETATVDWSNVQGTVSDDFFSLNLYKYPLPSETGNATYQSNLNYFSPGIVRLHNNNTTEYTTEDPYSLIDDVNQDWDYAQVQDTLDNLGNIPADKMISIPEFPSWMDTDDDAFLDAGLSDEFAQFCADLVEFTNITSSGTYIKYWEVTNELDDNYGDAGRMNELVSIWNEAYDAMKAVDPSIEVGGPGFQRPDKTANVDAFIDGVKDKIDFLSSHAYASGSAYDTDTYIYDRTETMLDEVQYVKNYFDSVSTRDVPLFLDEFNISWTYETFDERMTNHKGAVFDALMYAGGIKRGMAGMFPWNEKDGVYGKMDNDLTVRLPGDLLNLTSAHMLGDWVQSGDSSSRVETLAVKNGSKRAFMVIHRSLATDRTLSTTFSGWGTEPADTDVFTEYQISSAGLTTSSVTYADLKNGISLDPHSVTIYVYDESGSGGSTVLNPTDDTFVRGGSHADTNYGSSGDLKVKDSTSDEYTREAYLKFDLTGVGSVNSATLRLYGSNIQDAESTVIKAYSSSDDSWNEGTLTWNTQPSRSTNPIDQSSVDDQPRYIEFDVTGFVQSEASRDDVVTIVLECSNNSNNQLVFDSMESGGNLPELVIQ